MKKLIMFLPFLYFVLSVNIVIVQEQKLQIKDVNVQNDAKDLVIDPVNPNDV
jgi:hypothetical protein